MINKSQGFTLIELLIVIGILAIIATAVIITVTPGERLREARNSTRASHMAAIGSAFHLTTIAQPATFPSVASIMLNSSCLEGAATVTAFRNFGNPCAVLIGLGTAAPVDPQGGLYRVRATTTGTDSRLEIQMPAGATDPQLTPRTF